MKEKIASFRPAAAAFITMMAMSLTASTISFFLEPVCAQLGVSRGSFSFVFSLMTLSGALTNPALGRFAGRRGVKRILFTSSLWGCGSMLLFAAADSLWLVYAASLLLGAFGTNCVALCANVIVQSAYDARKAYAILGFVMAGSGVGGMLFNLIVPAVMAAFSWRQAMAVMGLCWLGTLLLAALVLGKESRQAPGRDAPGAGLGMTRAQALKSREFYLLVLVIIVITACCGIQQQQPSMLTLYGFDAGTASMLLSAQTAVLALGKIIQGFVYGKFGVRRGGCAVLLLFAAGCVAVMSRALVYPGLVLLALGFGAYTTLMPLVTRQVFGTRDYAAIWGVLATAGSVGTFLANPVWGAVYDLTGRYTLGLAVAPVLLAAAAWILHRVLKGVR